MTPRAAVFALPVWLALACGAAAVDLSDDPQGLTAEAPAPDPAGMSDGERVDAARLLALEERYDDALALLQAAEDPENLRVLNYTGYVLRKSGRAEEALTYYRRALEIDPGYIDARSYLGQALLDMGDTAGAEEQLLEIRRRGARDSYAYVALKQAIREKTGY
jgi:tetratricopeptide (TPR) repeat protein